MKNFSKSPNPKVSENAPELPQQESETQPHNLTAQMSKDQIGQFADMLLKMGRSRKIGDQNEPNRAKTRPLARDAIRASTNRLPLAR